MADVTPRPTPDTSQATGRRVSEEASPLEGETISRNPVEDTEQKADFAYQVEFLADRLQRQGVNGKAALERADLDGCLTTDNPMLWSLINIHFASGTGYEDGVGREVVPVVIPKKFSMESIWNALAGHFGKKEDSTQSAESFVRERLEKLTPEPKERTRGKEGIHLAIRLDLQDPLLALSVTLPDAMRKVSEEVWEPISNARAEYDAAITDLSNLLDELNEKYLATFCLCVSEARTLVGERLKDTVWL